jgi:DNA repair exonuclease SbcCD nuclease subunit
MVKMSIYITGDVHGSIDIHKLNKSNFPEQERMAKSDYLIVCGDFGLVWDNSSEEMYWRNWLHKRNFTTIFVGGNHEGFSLLNKYSIEKWNGGKVHYINDSIIHLMRGQIYEIEGYKFFTMGGATSIDKYRRIEGKSWWPEEIPSQKEFNEALDNLDKHDWKIDYILSHTVSTRIMEKMNYIKENNPLNSFFDMLEDDLKYKHWFFGHFHDDIEVDDKHTLLYDKIIKLRYKR